INECDTKLAKCPQNSECHNTIGSYACSCNKGFRPENSNCVPMLAEVQTTQVSDQKKQSSCDQMGKKEQFIYCTFKNDCDKKSDCIYDLHSRNYTCKCWPGYFGNGFKCYSWNFC
ncbi:Kunitz Bovine pancreatic trypsin inhibitor domain, partial [Brachionus plicatilis]